MTVFDRDAALDLVLDVQAPSADPGSFTLTLDDGAGNTGSGVFTFDPGRQLAGAPADRTTWEKFLGASVPSSRSCRRSPGRGAAPAAPRANGRWR